MPYAYRPFFQSPSPDIDPAALLSPAERKYLVMLGYQHGGNMLRREAPWINCFSLGCVREGQTSRQFGTLWSLVLHSLKITAVQSIIMLG